MSKIFDALKHAQSVRADKKLTKPAGGVPEGSHERRQSRRWAIDIPVYVYGHDPKKEPFHEVAHTLSVNANGALLLLSVPVHKGQTLLLTNSLTQQEQDCSVVFLGQRRSRTIEAGIAFPATNSRFWQIPRAPKDKPAA